MCVCVCVCVCVFVRVCVCAYVSIILCKWTYVNFVVSHFLCFMYWSVRLCVCVHIVQCAVKYDCDYEYDFTCFCMNINVCIVTVKMWSLKLSSRVLCALACAGVICTSMFVHVWAFVCRSSRLSTTVRA